MTSSSWSKLLIGGHVGAQHLTARSVELRDSVDLQLDEIICAARLAWPTVELASEPFVAHLARHLPAGMPVETALGQMHTKDLYLARACALGNNNALQAFERHCLDGLEYVVSSYGAFSDLVTEVKQRVREDVLVGDVGPPKIEGFSGRGELRSWVRVLAVREAIRLVRRSRRETSIDDDTPLHAFVTPGDAELEHVKARYVEEFKQAFSAALRDLSPRDQTLLRQHAIDGVTIDQLGVLYHMHRATAARNLQRVRRAVLVATRARLATRLDVRPSELDSILRLVRSRLDVTLRWLVRRRRRPEQVG
jgi:RNA polymerase sigma-70 factor, ECF subfamily